jgi:hypothetical protein
MRYRFPGFSSQSRIFCPEGVRCRFTGVNRVRRNGDAGPGAVRADTLHLPDRWHGSDAL